MPPRWTAFRFWIYMKIIILIFAAFLSQMCAGKEAKTLKLEDYNAPKHKICEVHNVELQKTVVPLTYGDIHYDADYLEASKNEFQYAADTFHNAHNAKNYEFAEVLFCAECRRAKERWLQNRKTPAP